MLIPSRSAPGGEEKPLPPPHPRPSGSRGRRSLGLPLQLLLLLNLQPGAPGARGVLLHFGAHDLPAMFGETGDCGLSTGLRVELPAGRPWTPGLGWQRRSDSRQGRAARLASATGPLGWGSGQGAAGGGR